MNNIAKCILNNKNYRNRKHKVERGDYFSTYTYDGFKMIEFYHTLNLLVFHRPIIQKGIIKTFEGCGLDVKWTDSSLIYEMSTRFGYQSFGCTIKYDLFDWDSGFVAVKNLFNKTLSFRQKDLVYTLINRRLGTGIDQPPRPQSEAGQSAS